MFGRQEPDVLVVGAGPVGLFGAICLRERGVRVQVIDKERRPAAHSYALALHPSTLRMFAQAGLDPSSIDRSMNIKTMSFHDRSACRATVRFDELAEPYGHVRIVRQSTLEQWLERELRSRGTEVQWRHRLARWHEEGDRLVAEIEELDEISTGYPIAMAEAEVVKRTKRKPRLLFGMDGHRSSVRRRLGVKSLEMGSPQLFGVFEFDCREFPSDEIRVIIDGGHTSVLWPLPDGRFRWSFQVDWTTSENEDYHYKSRVAVQVGNDYFPQLDEALLREMIEARAPWFEAEIGTIYWAVLARFERRLVERFGEGQVWLAGDSAHLTGPVGVQSMNVGLREALHLAKLAARPPDAEPSAYEEYGRQQAREWRMLLGAEGVRASGEASEFVGKHWERIIPCLPVSGRDLQLLAGQIGLEVADPAGDPAVGPKT